MLCLCSSKAESKLFAYKIQGYITLQYTGQETKREELGAVPGNLVLCNEEQRQNMTSFLWVGGLIEMCFSNTVFEVYSQIFGIWKIKDKHGRH